MKVVNIETYRLHKLDETNKEAHRGILGLIAQLQVVSPTTFNTVAMAIYRGWLELDIEQRRRLFLEVNISEAVMRIRDANRMVLGLTTEQDLLITIDSRPVGERFTPEDHDRKSIKMLTATPKVLGALTVLIGALDRLSTTCTVNIKAEDGRQFMRVEHPHQFDRVTIEVHANTMESVVKAIHSSQ